jgi:transcriptional regulator with XRE-family HTH domain
VSAWDPHNVLGFMAMALRCSRNNRPATDDTALESTAAWVKAQRQAKGLSQRALGKLLWPGRDEANAEKQVAGYERGRRGLKPDVLRKVSAVLGLSPYAPLPLIVQEAQEVLVPAAVGTTLALTAAMTLHEECSDEEWLALKRSPEAWRAHVEAHNARVANKRR